MDSTTPAPQFDKYGFELGPCGRCGGSGFYSRNRHGQTHCYSCEGPTPGLALTRKAGKAKAEWLAANKAAGSKLITDLQVGDRVRVPINGWVTITAAAVPDTLNPGRVIIGYGSTRIHDYETSTYQLPGIHVDPAPYAEGSRRKR